MTKRSDQLSPLDALVNKSPHNIIRNQEDLKRRQFSQEQKNVEADSADEMTNVSGSMYSSENSGAFTNSTLEVLRLSQVDFENGTYKTAVLPAGALIDDNIVELVVTGQSMNNTGGSKSCRPRVFLETGGGTLVSSGDSISMPTSATPRMWTYTAYIQQAPCLGNFVQVDEKLIIESPTSAGTTLIMARSTITALATQNIEEELDLWFQLAWSGATSYINIWTKYNMWKLSVIDGTSDFQKYFWTQPTGTRGYDTRINDNTATTNFGNDTVLHVGESSSTAAIGRTLIKFTDIANIPKNAIIDAARLWMCIETDSSTNARTFEVFRVLRNWTAGDGSAGSGATWNTYDGSSSWTTAGCSGSGSDYNSTVLASCSFTATQTLGTFMSFSFDTAEFQKFVDGTYENQGWLIKAQTETNDRYHFHSADSASPSLSPILEVLYHLP